MLEILAGLDSKDQDECLEAIIHALREASEEGFSHVIERLQKGRVGENPGNEVAVPSYVIDFAMLPAQKRLAGDSLFF